MGLIPTILIAFGATAAAFFIIREIVVVSHGAPLFEMFLEKAYIYDPSLEEIFEVRVQKRKDGSKFCYPYQFKSIMVCDLLPDGTVSSWYPWGNAIWSYDKDFEYHKLINTFGVRDGHD